MANEEFQGLLGGFAQGLSGQLGKQFDEGRKSRMELMLKSAQIEQELKAKQALDMSQGFGGAESDVLRTGAGMAPTGQAMGSQQVQNAIAAQKAFKTGLGGGRSADQPLSEASISFLIRRYGGTREDYAGLKRGELSTVFKSGSDNAIKDIEAAVQSLGAVPSFYGKLKEYKNNPIMLGIAQTRGIAGLLAAPEVQQARAHMATLMAFSQGGKNLTGIEQAAIDKLATSWAYGPEEVEKAEKDFRDMLINNIKPRLESGQLGFARQELMSQFNAALMKNGLEPIPLDITDKAKKDSTAPTTTNPPNPKEIDLQRQAVDELKRRKKIKDDAKLAP